MPFRRRKDYELATLDDEDLLAYAVAARGAGDLDAMREALSILVFRRFDNTVRRARLKVPEEDAEEVATTALTDAAMSAFEGKSEGEFWKLLSTILKRRIADYHDKKSRTLDQVVLPEEHTDDEDIHGGPAGVTQDPTTAIPAQDLIDRLLEELSPPHRMVVALVVLEGYDAKTAADRVNGEHPDLDPPMSVDNVHQITSRFRKDLRGELEDSG